MDILGEYNVTQYQVSGFTVTWMWKIYCIEHFKSIREGLFKVLESIEKIVGETFLSASSGG